MQAPSHADQSPAGDQNAFVERVAELASLRLDDERVAALVQRLVAILVVRADQAPTGQESARRHNRIQSLIKRL
jgi:hypothetical protein